MPNKQEVIDIRIKSIKEAMEEVEKVEDFLKKGAEQLYTDIITPDIEYCANETLFSDIAITLDCTTKIACVEERETFLEALTSLKLKKVYINNWGQFLNRINDPVLFFPKEEGGNIYYRKSYLQEIVEKDGYNIEYDNNNSLTIISTTLPKLVKDEDGKVLIKKY